LIGAHPITYGRDPSEIDNPRFALNIVRWLVREL
jgi:hypothetical protein